MAYLTSLKVLKCPIPKNSNETVSWKFERAIFDKILEQMTLAQGKHNLCTEETVSRLFNIINTNNDRLLSFADV